MFGLVILFWSVFVAEEIQKVGADLPTGQFYDCSSISVSSGGDQAAKTIQARLDCINTGWCLWINSGTNANTCVYDECLKALSSQDEACPAALTNCDLYYVTDKHNCGTKQNPGDGSLSDYEDIYCRVAKSQTAYDKLPVDKCFYDDLAKRASDPVGSCGNKPCGWTGSSSTVAPGRYCRATDAQICADVLGDLPSFCECLGSTDGGKFCNLHPQCYMNGSTCVYDLCSIGTAAGTDACNGLPSSQAANECGGRYERRIDASGNLGGQSLYCANKAKNTNPNTCYWGLSATVESWQTTDGQTWPDCQDVTSVNKCTDIQVYNYTANAPIADTYCEVATIPTGWFAGTQICIDPGRDVPSLSAGTKLNAPSLFAMLLVVFAIASHLF